MTSVSVSTTGRERQRSLVDRVLAVFPALVIALVIFVFYAVEAWTRKTPWIFTDELEWTQISRSIASTGHAARRGDPIYFKSLYAYLIAPGLVDPLDERRVLGGQVRERVRHAARGDPDLPARADARDQARRGRRRGRLGRRAGNGLRHLDRHRRPRLSLFRALLLALGASARARDGAAT